MSAATAVAAVTDLRTRRIPNAVCAALALAAVAAHTAGGGPRAGAVAVLTILAVIALGLPAFVCGWFGGGDIKLFASCAGAVGIAGLPAFAAEVCIAGGVLCLIEALRRRRLRAVMLSTARTATGFGPSEQLRVPYGVAIAVAALYYTLHSLALTTPRSS
jgi:prepilin peptidase CpaA